MKVAFHSYQLGYRGTDQAVFAYAKYNQEILGNESIIISTNSRPNEMERLEDFQRHFKVCLYSAVWNEQNNSTLKQQIENILIEEKVDVFYAQKGGENDNIFPNVCKNIAHCVFRMDDPHADVYMGISEYLAKKYHKLHFVPYIVEIADTHEDLRKMLNIPSNALVIGRHGGFETFDLPFVHQAIINVLHQRKDIYFLFLATHPFAYHERIIYLSKTVNPFFKRKFFNTCNAMLHARRVGETFGLACAEFCLANRPVITYNGTQYSCYDRAHIDYLGKDGIYYTDQSDLEAILFNINVAYTQSITWSSVVSSTYNPSNVMQQFKQVCL